MKKIIHLLFLIIIAPTLALADSWNKFCVTNNSKDVLLSINANMTQLAPGKRLCYNIQAENRNKYVFSSLVYSGELPGIPVNLPDPIFQFEDVAVCSSAACNQKPIILFSVAPNPTPLTYSGQSIQGQSVYGGYLCTITVNNFDKQRWHYDIGISCQKVK